jgi:hypothetical protein
MDETHTTRQREEEVRRRLHPRRKKLRRKKLRRKKLRRKKLRRKTLRRNTDHIPRTPAWRRRRWQR